jgi:hypothetical protein
MDAAPEGLNWAAEKCWPLLPPLRQRNIPESTCGQELHNIVLGTIPFHRLHASRLSRKSLLRESLLSLAEKVLYPLQQTSSTTKIEEA